jgi:hypothetical protein
LYHKSSLSPYTDWKQVELSAGNIHFPNTQSLLHSLPSVQKPPPSFPNYKHPVRWNERYHSKTPDEYPFGEETIQTPNTSLPPPAFKPPWTTPLPTPSIQQDAIKHHLEEPVHRNQSFPQNVGTIPKTLNKQYLNEVLQEVTSTLAAQSCQPSQTQNNQPAHRYSTRIRLSQRPPRHRQLHREDYADLNFSPPQHLASPLLPTIHAKAPITSSVIQPQSNVQQTQTEKDEAALQAALQHLHFSEQSSPQSSAHSYMHQSPSAVLTTAAKTPVTSVQGAQALSPSFLQPPAGTFHLPASPPMLGSLQYGNLQTFHPPPDYSEIVNDPFDTSGDPFTLPLPPSPNRQFLNSSADSTISG